MEIQGEQLDLSSPPSLRAARDIMSVAIRVMQDGTKHAFGNSLAVYFSDDHFVVESVPVQPDQLGRESPIVSYGSLPVPDHDTLTGQPDHDTLTGQMVVNDIIRFASRHELTYENDHDWIALANIIDNVLKKKERMRKLTSLKNWKTPILISNLLIVISMTLWMRYGLKRYLVVLIVSLLVPVTALLITRERPKREHGSSN